MATPIRPTEAPLQANRPAGSDGDGLDAYPTYHDGPTTAGAAPQTRPTDTALSRSRRTYGWPLLIGLLIFALVIVIRIVWGGMNMAATSDAALTPADGATTPVSGAPVQQGTPTAADETAESPGTLDRDVEAQSQASPGEVEATPGSVDAPGGDVTQPVREAPAQ